MLVFPGQPNQTKLMAICCHIVLLGFIAEKVQVAKFVPKQKLMMRVKVAWHLAGFDNGI
jgi:hypothetical protein